MIAEPLDAELYDYLPLDVLPEGYADGDDTTVGRQALISDVHALTSMDAVAARAATAVAVPFRRELRPHRRGDDVHAVQHTLRMLNFRKAWATSAYGSPTKDQVHAFQKKHGLHADGIYGPKTHAVMSKRFDSRARTLYLKGWNPYESQRDKIVKAAFHGYNNRGSIHYTQSAWRYWGDPYGRMYGRRHTINLSGIPRYEDCSSFGTWCYWLAGSHDPNGLDFNGYGFTGTMLAHGHWVPLSSAKPGDLVFYGSPVSHVAVYVGGGRVISHGSEIGPLLLSVNYRSDFNHVRNYF